MAGVMKKTVVGYADRFSVMPGETDLRQGE